MAARFSDDFTLRVIAEPSDIDQNGHVSNLVYLRWVLEAAQAHSEAVGWGRDAYLRVGCAFFVRRHEIDYLAAAVFGDALDVTTYVASWSAASSVRATHLVRAADGKEVARCTTTWAFVGANGRPRRILPALADAFRSKGAHDAR